MVCAKHHLAQKMSPNRLGRGKGRLSQGACQQCARSKVCSAHAWPLRSFSGLGLGRAQPVDFPSHARRHRLNPIADPKQGHSNGRWWTGRGARIAGQRLTHGSYCRLRRCRRLACGHLPEGRRGFFHSARGHCHKIDQSVRSRPFGTLGRHGGRGSRR